VIIGFAFIGDILFHDPVLVSRRPKVVYLDLDSMREASNDIIDTLHGPSVEKIFPANHQNTKSGSIPWADTYLCHSFSNADSLSGDTLILLLDTKTDNSLYKIEEPDEYWTGLKKASRFRKCRIVVPEEQLERIKRARYKYTK